MPDNRLESLQDLGWRAVTVSLGTVDLAGEFLANPLATAQDLIRNAERRGTRVARRLEKSNSLAKRSFTTLRREAGRTASGAGSSIRASLGVVQALVTEETPAATPVRRSPRSTTRRSAGTTTRRASSGTGRRTTRRASVAVETAQAS